MTLTFTFTFTLDLEFGCIISIIFQDILDIEEVV
jgi:hypothetical protein